jgi:hypothetical protein
MIHRLPCPINSNTKTHAIVLQLLTLGEEVYLNQSFFRSFDGIIKLFYSTETQALFYCRLRGPYLNIQLFKHRASTRSIFTPTRITIFSSLTYNHKKTSNALLRNVEHRFYKGVLNFQNV